MAMDAGGAKGSLKADINVTPLVDVMLVLLIIMMLIAPMIYNDRGITLPRAGNSTEKPDTQAQTVVAIDASSRFYVNAIPVRPDDLGISAGAEAVAVALEPGLVVERIVDLAVEEQRDRAVRARHRLVPAA